MGATPLSAGQTGPGKDGIEARKKPLQNPLFSGNACHAPLLTVNACRGVVLDAQVNVLGDAKPEVAGLGEVAADELVLLDLQAGLL